jgi:hypothetical protein
MSERRFFFQELSSQQPFKQPSPQQALNDFETLEQQVPQQSRSGSSPFAPRM